MAIGGFRRDEYRQLGVKRCMLICTLHVVHSARRRSCHRAKVGRVSGRGRDSELGVEHSFASFCTDHDSKLLLTTAMPIPTSTIKAWTVAPLSATHPFGVAVSLGARDDRLPCSMLLADRLLWSFTCSCPYPQISGQNLNTMDEATFKELEELIYVHKVRLCRLLVLLSISLS